MGEGRPPSAVSSVRSDRPFGSWRFNASRCAARIPGLDRLVVSLSQPRNHFLVKVIVSPQVVALSDLWREREKARPGRVG
jgi:hypothetical protein